MGSHPEAYVRLVDADQIQGWESRGHFFSAAAEAMRRILIESARSKQSQQRGGDRVHVANGDPADVTSTQHRDFLLDVDDKLVQLEQADPAVAEMVKLRLYAGLSTLERGRR